MEDSEGTVIYVLPTEEGQPPRAAIGTPVEGGIEGALATWSRDSGTWEVAGMPLPQELADAITQHAKDLGVEW